MEQTVCPTCAQYSTCERSRYAKILPESVRAIQNYQFMQMTGTLPGGRGFGQEGIRTMLLFREIDQQLSQLRQAERAKSSGSERK